MHSHHTGPPHSERSQVWVWMLCCCCLKILNNFIFEFLFCKWSQMGACFEGLEPLFPCGSTSLRCVLRLVSMHGVLGLAQTSTSPPPPHGHCYLSFRVVARSHRQSKDDVSPWPPAPVGGLHEVTGQTGVQAYSPWKCGMHKAAVSCHGLASSWCIQWATRQWPLAYPWSRYLTDLCRQWEIGNLLECCHSAMGWAMDLWEVENELLSLDQYQQSILHWSLHIMQLILCSAMVYQKNKTKT